MGGVSRFAKWPPPGADFEEGCELLRERKNSSHNAVVEQDTKEERNVFVAAKLQLTCGAPHHEAISVIQRRDRRLPRDAESSQPRTLIKFEAVVYGERVPSKIRKNSLSEKRAFLPSRTMIRSIEGITISR